MPPRLSPTSLYAIQPLKASSFPSSTPPILWTLPFRPLCFSKTPIRSASRRDRQRPQYDRRHDRFENAQNPYASAKTSHNLRCGVGVVVLGLGGFWYYNREQVPVSGRWRFNCISPAIERRLTESLYQRVMRAYERDFLPPLHPDSRLVNKVLNRLIPAAGLEGQNWEVKVIDDPDQCNAFVVPGGKVFVFSGILPICADEDGLAAVLAHEIAHNVAHHASETMSTSLGTVVAGLVLTWYFDISVSFAQFILDYVIERPGSRRIESEAHHIGLLMMAQACYDPGAAATLLERMVEEEQHAMPQFLSTHPASQKRMEAIQEWLPEAQQKRAESVCGGTIEYMDGFRSAFEHGDDGLW